MILEHMPPPLSPLKMVSKEKDKGGGGQFSTFTFHLVANVPIDNHKCKFMGGGGGGGTNIHTLCSERVVSLIWQYSKLVLDGGPRIGAWWVACPLSKW